MLQMNKIVVCPDSFKGSLSAFKVAESITQGLREGGFDGEIVQCPLADGGEGMTDIITSRDIMTKVVVESCDALLRPVMGEYIVDEKTGTAFIESAKFVGLNMLDVAERNPLEASSQGLGVAIADACNRNYRNIYVTLGGSAVCDGGMGMLSALGVKFFDAEGNILKGNGREMNNITRIDNSELAIPGLRRFYAVCDVENPLLGINGAVNVFALQKGALPNELPVLEKGMENLVKKASEAGLDANQGALEKGAGAAGGLGFALYSFLGAHHLSGIDFILKRIDFNSLIADASLVITGEGKLDRQSFMGKVVGGVLQRAVKIGIPVIAVAGIIEDRTRLNHTGLKGIYEIGDPTMTLEQNMKHDITVAHLKSAGLSIAKAIASHGI